MKLKSLTLLTLWLATLCVAGFAAKIKCPICGMNFSQTAKTGFEVTHEGKILSLCSFSCAHRYHRKFPNSSLHAHDFENGTRIDATEAFFLIKSKNILKELEFDMPPSVVAFRDEETAKKHQVRVKDGEIVRGYGNLEKALE